MFLEIKIILWIFLHFLCFLISINLYGFPLIEFEDKLNISNICGLTLLTGMFVLVFIPCIWQLFERYNPNIYKIIEMNLMNSFLASVVLTPILPYIINNSIRYKSSKIEIIFDIAIFLLLGDTVFYWTHIISHNYDLLWKSHRKHHNLNNSINISAIAATSSGFIDFLFTNITIFVLPFLLKKIAYESVAISLSFMIFWPPFIHSTNIKLPTSNYFMDPSNHQVHHRTGRKNGNYGGYFLFWDKLCGTYIHPNSLN